MTAVDAALRNSPSAGELLRTATRELARARVDCPRLDAEWLLMTALGWSRERLYRDLLRPLEAAERALFEHMVSRRCLGEPAAYVTGHREFWSLDFKVSRDVLVPRPETECLVETGLDFLASWTGPSRVLELGTGSGALAVSLAHEREDIEIWATDISAAALEIARENARRHGVFDRIHFLEGDLFGALGGEVPAFAAVVSNPPYIACGDISDLPAAVRDWEPSLALDGGPDGTMYHRRIIAGGGRHLLPGGLLALEIDCRTADTVCGLMRAETGFNPGTVIRDYAGRERVVWACRTSR